MTENFTTGRFYAFYLFVTTSISPNNSNNLQIKFWILLTI